MILVVINSFVKYWGSLKVVAILNYTNLLKRRALYKDIGKIIVKLSYFDFFLYKMNVYGQKYHWSKLKTYLVVICLSPSLLKSGKKSYIHVEMKVCLKQYSLYLTFIHFAISFYIFCFISIPCSREHFLKLF